jgi:hypothetical protein
VWWWVKDRLGRRQALCLGITKGKGKLLTSRCSKRKADSTLTKRLSSGGARKKDKKISVSVKGCQGFKVRARC